MNYVRTALLLAALTGLFLAVGYLLGGASGMAIAFLFAFGTNLFAYWNSDKMVLRMYNAQEVDAQNGGEYYVIVRDLAQRAGLPMPRVYVIDEAQPNAFPTGRSPEHAAVAATRGILGLLSARELRGVMSHELAHVKHRDILTSTITATVAGAISVLAQFGIFFGGGDRDRPNFAVQLALMILAIGAVAWTFWVQSASAIASSWLCVTWMKLIPSRVCSAFSSSRMRTRRKGSSADSGSSSSSTCGSVIRARASPPPC